MTSSADPAGWLCAIASASPTATMRSPSRTTAPPKMMVSASSMVTTSPPVMMILSGMCALLVRRTAGGRAGLTPGAPRGPRPY